MRRGWAVEVQRCHWACRQHRCGRHSRTRDSSWRDSCWREGRAAEEKTGWRQTWKDERSERRRRKQTKDETWMAAIGRMWEREECEAVEWGLEAPRRG